jgi:hypothetical protein
MVKESENSWVVQGKSVQALIKKFEYELLFNIESSITESKPISFEQAILSFKKDIERTGVKVKQILVITTKVNYFKNYCFSLGVNELSEINRSHASSYMNDRSATFLTPSTLNKESDLLEVSLIPHTTNREAVRLTEGVPCHS